MISSGPTKTVVGTCKIITEVCNCVTTTVLKVCAVLRNADEIEVRVVERYVAVLGEAGEVDREGTVKERNVVDATKLADDV